MKKIGLLTSFIVAALATTSSFATAFHYNNIHTQSGLAFSGQNPQLPPTPGTNCVINYSIDAPPSGVTINVGTGEISGNHTGVDSSGYTVHAYDADAGGCADIGVDHATTSASIAFFSAPDAPTITSATPDNSAVLVYFTPGAANGSTITSYTATSTPDSHLGSNSFSPIAVSSLDPGTVYTFTVHADN